MAIYTCNALRVLSQFVIPPVAPGYVVWTFKSLIQATLQPQAGWNIVKEAYDEPGGGLEGTIFQLFPVMGVFQLK